MRVKLRMYEVEAYGGAAAVEAALAPFLTLMNAPPPRVGPGLASTRPLEEAVPAPTMQAEAAAFLAHHGFTAKNFHEQRKRDEDVTAFVARREVERAVDRAAREAIRAVDGATVVADTRKMTAEQAAGYRGTTPPASIGLYPTAIGATVPLPAAAKKPRAKKAAPKAGKRVKAS